MDYITIEATHYLVFFIMFIISILGLILSLIVFCYLNLILSYLVISTCLIYLRWFAD
jgi:hypothetical protein